MEVPVTDFTIDVSELKRCVLITLAGRIDSSKAAAVESALNEQIEQGNYRFVIDMSDVDYVSSAFLRVMISKMKTTKKWNRGNVYLAAMQPRIVDVFELAGITELFKTYPNVTEAVGDW
jgi:anti-anti-sigma factor